MLTPRNIFTNPYRDDEFLPTGWVRLPILYPINLAVLADVLSDNFAHLNVKHDTNHEIHYSFEMFPEVREWCRDQFGYEPVLYITFGKLFVTSYSTVFSNPEHAMAFTLRWL